MSRYWSDTVRMLTPYVPGEQPKLDNLVKLNTNENPYGPSPCVIAAIAEAAGDSLRLYPDPNSDKLKSAIAANFDTAPAQVFVGNGSDEVLAFVFLALLKHGKPILFPDITYSFYPVYCSLFEIAYKTVALNEKFEIDVADFLSNDIQDCGGIIFPNPNAPTGCLLGLDAIEKLLQAKPDTVIVVDEAYVDFGGETAIPLVAKYPNLLVVQTLSKSRSLAGLRVGFAVGHADLVEALERVKNSFNSYPLDRLAQAAAVAALDDRDYFDTTCKAVIDTREHMINDLKGLGFEVLPSAANFVFARNRQHDAAALAAKLREHHIIVRHFKLPRIDQFLRISVGTNEQCAVLTAALREILA